MKAKPTLRIDKKAADLARKFAGSHQTSLSGMVESYLEQLIREEEERAGDVTPLVQELTGILRLKPYSKPRKNRHSPHQKRMT